MNKVVSYKDLIVWQKSMELAKKIYRLTALFPRDELYGIVSQMRRAVVSIPSNIAEGFGRKTNKDTGQLFIVAYASALELETQLLLAQDIHLADNSEFSKSYALLTEVLRMLNKMTSNYRNNQFIPNN